MRVEGEIPEGVAGPHIVDFEVYFFEDEICGSLVFGVLGDVDEDLKGFLSFVELLPVEEIEVGGYCVLGCRHFGYDTVTYAISR